MSSLIPARRGPKGAARIVPAWFRHARTLSRLPGRACGCSINLTDLPVKIKAIDVGRAAGCRRRILTTR